MDFLMIIMGVFTFLAFIGWILYMIYDHKQHTALMEKAKGGIYNRHR